VQASPFVQMADDLLASAASFCLAVIFLISCTFKYGTLLELDDIRQKMSPEQESLYVLDQGILTTVIICAVIGVLLVSSVIFAVMVVAEGSRHRQEMRAAKARRLRYRSDNNEVSVPSIGSDGHQFHLFLSHVWGSGQDQMRIVKTRLIEMMPDVKVFLDVDDLTEGKGAEFVDASVVTLVFASSGYFTSPNCMRELLRAVVKRKPMFTLLEPEPKHGGLSKEQVHESLSCNQDCDFYGMCGLAAEVSEWGFSVPTADELFAALFVKEPIDWVRIGIFQDISMRLIANHILRDGHIEPSPAAATVAVNRHILSILDGESAHGLHKAAGTAHAWKETYLQGEVSLERPVVGPPLNTFHIFCSSHNPGGSALLEEVASELSLELKLTSDEENMEVCDCVLVYLTSLTWTQGTASNAFAMFVKRAMDNNVPLLLAHEMPGLGGQEARHAVDFAAFFSCANGTTPQELLHAGIYSQIAIPLKGGPWRSASLVIIAHSLAKLGAVKSKDTVKAVAALAP